ncbi:kynureninase [Fusibacter sp. 3D3]|uniref:kynureninase n=1 Tax=Fusibacter sp. 3D3 TaxID=1048380 RepID=UPI000853EDBF|nr:kynureninase [Fusibacter sp. 3D3]GAU78326.1 kynureninase homolog [Fusibacter sp. 3D3]
MKRLFETDREFAKRLDAEDPLFKIRDHFYITEGELYMDGNSLGLCSKDAERGLLEAFDVWKHEGIKIWGTQNGRFFNYSRRIAEKLAPLLNADSDEIAIMGSITSNIHQALATFYKPTTTKYKIVVDALNFPTDIYATKSIIELLGYRVDETLITIQSEDGRTLDVETIIGTFKEDVALVLLPAVLYRSAQLLDLKKITDAAHEKGIIIGWDLAHSIGAVPHDFKAAKPDFAVWCSYKYLNGGPGAVAGLYINRKHFGISAGLKGWFGNQDDTQFLLSHDFEQDHDANGLLLGTPHILSMAPLDAMLDLFNVIGMDAIREKSLNITAYLMSLVDSKLTALGYTIGNPRADHQRGGHVCLEHPEGYRISLALRDLNIIPDYREPNVIRLAPVALYVSYEEVYHLVEILEKIIIEKIYESYSLKRVTVL